ncbi:MAG: hypothetical protein KIT86_03335 [Hydrogenophaga sp.]|uniref:hypothetical protein n=1 Tax=Hydrogenophaga sp. TaxID=1904254 RepID=UPI002633F2F6|nr:hypothetical protein [Hydrogenophaga sp.]MCW5668668.1 hypothetical protein [Hydrogenophaga sp.]
MNAEVLLYELLECGITPSLTPDGNGIVVPAGRLTAEQRVAVLAQKQALIDCIQKSALLTSELLQAAMRVCDAWNDTESAREQMREDVLHTPPHLRGDLLGHLKKAYGDRPNAGREEER